MALGRLRAGKFVGEKVLRTALGAISVGVVEGEPVLDLCYAEDARAQVDMNIVGTAEGRFAEVQGTGEEHTFSREQLNEMLRLAELGISRITQEQQRVLADAGFAGG